MTSGSGRAAENKPRRSTLADLASQRQVSMRQVLQWLEDGMPADRTDPNKVRVSLREVDQWLYEREGDLAVASGAGKAIVDFVRANPGCSEDDIVGALPEFGTEFGYGPEYVRGELGHLIFLGRVGEQGHEPPDDFLGEPPFAYRVLEDQS